MNKQFIRYCLGTIAHPRSTFEALAAETSVRWAFLLACFPVAQVWGNMGLHAFFGLDWLGTRPLLSDPTFIAGFGYWRIDLAHWVPVFAVVLPFMTVLSIVTTAGLAQLLSKAWGGRGTFEQMVNTLTFASVIPNLVIGAVSEWVFGVPMDLITGQRYWWQAAMRGDLGPTVSVLWNGYVFGLYIIVQWGWTVVLGSVAIRRVQRVPVKAAVVIMLLVFVSSMFLSSIFTR